MREQVRAWQDQGDEIVFTNGCFDILHLGHIDYLEGARDLGDRLIIGLNSDASTQRLKGDARPINAEQSRAYLLASLSVVDLVTVFDEDTPAELIAEVLPDILVKGGDYTEADVVGGVVVKAHGGKVIILPYKEGFSTTSIEQKILSLAATNNKDA
jgi:D-beta-D-heptose 7-phosphate kinase/D-beta-D-heptose 1-phosphate adenosyltransferase